MIVKRLERLLEGACALLLLSLMLVTCVDVVGRYFFNRPLGGAFELTELMLGALVFAGLPLVSARGEHVEVDLLVSTMGAGFRGVVTRVAGVFSAAVLLVFAWRLVDLWQTMLEDGTRSVSLGIPYAPLALIGAFACLLSAVGMVLRHTQQ